MFVLLMEIVPQSKLIQVYEIYVYSRDNKNGVHDSVETRVYKSEGRRIPP